MRDAFAAGGGALPSAIAFNQARFATGRVVETHRINKKHRDEMPSKTKYSENENETSTKTSAHWRLAGVATGARRRSAVGESGPAADVAPAAAVALGDVDVVDAVDVDDDGDERASERSTSAIRS